MPKLPETNIGIWGERYLAYIREHKKLLHTKLMINGTLYTHLAVSKTSFFEFVIDGNAKGTFTMG